MYLNEALQYQIPFNLNQTLIISPLTMSISFSSTAQSKTFKKNKHSANRKDVTLKGKTKYIPLLPGDALYSENLFKLRNPQFQNLIAKVLQDLTALLYFTDEDFFYELEVSDSLRICLQSCLVCFCKNSCYNLCESLRSKEEQQKLSQSDDFLLYYQKLNEIVLRIYLRIVETEKQQHKQIIYNSWLLDIPKMVDLSMIYCVRNSQSNQYTNLQLLRHVISKAVLSNPTEYSKDFDDFINILYEDKLPMIHNDIKYLINLTPQAMQKAKKNFDHPLKSFLITANKILFEIKDLFAIITYIYICFPENLRQRLGTDHQILEDTIKIFIEFVQNSPNWKVDQFQKQFQINFRDIHRAACEAFLNNFRILREVIQKGDQLLNSNYSRALTSYSVHCLYLTSKRIHKDHQKIYRRMIQTLIFQLGAHDLFSLKEAPSNLKFIKLSEEQKQSIRKSWKTVREWEQNIAEAKQENKLSQTIKQRIQNFFSKNARPRQQDRIKESLKKENQNLESQKFEKIRLEERRPLNEGEDWNETSFDYSQLLEADHQDAKDSQLDLSFDVLRSSSDEEQQKQVVTKNAKDEPKQRQQISCVPSQQLLRKIYLYEQNLRSIHRKSVKLQFEDEFQQEEEQKQLYFHSNRPEIGFLVDVQNLTPLQALYKSVSEEEKPFFQRVYPTIDESGNYIR